MAESRPEVLCEDDVGSLLIQTTEEVSTARGLSLTPLEGADTGWGRTWTNAGVLFSWLQAHHRSAVAFAAGSGWRAERFLHHNTPPGRLEMMMMACMMREMASDFCSRMPTRLKKNT